MVTFKIFVSNWSNSLLSFLSPVSVYSIKLSLSNNWIKESQNKARKNLYNFTYNAGDNLKSSELTLGELFSSASSEIQA